MKKFKLFKDVPSHKAGAILKSITDYVFFVDGETKYGFDVEYCQKFPEWFEEIKDEPKKTVRRWLWVHKEDSKFWIVDNYWFSEQEAETHYKSCGITNYKKTILNGQEAFRDFEE